MQDTTVQTGKNAGDLEKCREVQRMHDEHQTPIRTACAKVGISRRRFYYLTEQKEKSGDPARPAAQTSSTEASDVCPIATTGDCPNSSVHEEASPVGAETPAEANEPRI